METYETLMTGHVNQGVSPPPIITHLDGALDDNDFGALPTYDEVANPNGKHFRPNKKLKKSMRVFTFLYLYFYTYLQPRRRPTTHFSGEWKKYKKQVQACWIFWKILLFFCLARVSNIPSGEHIYIKSWLILFL